MMSLLVVAAIVVAVALGYKTKINIGLFAIAFAYLIGAFGMGLSPSEIIAMWPLKIFFVILSVCLFYSFATVNGTLEKLAEHLIHHCRCHNCSPLQCSSPPRSSPRWAPATTPYWRSWRRSPCCSVSVPA